MKKSYRTKLREKLDKLWSKVVRTRDRYICQWCQYRRGEEIFPNKRNHAHHIIAKGACGFHGRFMVNNGITLCYYCHIYLIKQKSREFNKFLDKWLLNNGLTYNELECRIKAASKMTTEEMEERCEQLENTLIILETENEGL